MQDISNLSVKHIEAIQAVAKHGTMSKAADAIGYSQSQVSRLILDAERAIGAPLFVRSGSGAEVTEAGAYFLSTTMGITRELQKSVSEAQRIAGGKVQSLRIGYSSLSFGIVSALIQDHVRPAFPGVHVILCRQSGQETVRMLESGSLDIGLTHPPEPSTGLLAHHSWLDPLCWVTSVGTDLDLYSDNYLFLPPKETLPALYGRILTKIENDALKLKIRHQPMDIFDAILYASSGSGFTLLPESLVRIFGQTVTFHPAGNTELLSVPVALVTPKSVAPSILSWAEGLNEPGVRSQFPKTSLY